MNNPIQGFRLAASDFSVTGRALERPECILAQPDGTLFVADRRAVVTRIDPDGRQTLIGEMPPMPNGMAMERDGSILVANIETGEFFRMRPDGSKTLLLDRFEERPLGSLNFVYVDEDGRIWLTISTRTVPRAKALAEPIADGLLLRLDPDGTPRLMGKDFVFTNEVRISRAKDFIYVAETMAGRISRAPLSASGDVGAFSPFGPDPLYPGAKVDGITFDAFGNLWVTELSRNALVVLTPEGEAVTVFEDPDGTILRTPTSLTFGGPDLKTAYVGSLTMDHLPTFRSPVAGEPLYHWGRMTQS